MNMQRLLRETEVIYKLKQKIRRGTSLDAGLPSWYELLNIIIYHISHIMEGAPDCNCSQMLLVLLQK